MRQTIKRNRTIAAATMGGVGSKYLGVNCLSQLTQSPISGNELSFSERSQMHEGVESRITRSASVTCAPPNSLEFGQDLCTCQLTSQMCATQKPLKHFYLPTKIWLQSFSISHAAV